MAGQRQAPNMDLFDVYFRRADLDHDGRISGPEAVAFFQGSNLSKQVLAQIWMHADKNRIGFLGRAEFYNALKLITVAQSKRDLTPEMVNAALYGPASAQIPPPQINFPSGPAGPSNPTTSVPPRSSASPMPSQNVAGRGPQGTPNASMGQQFFPSQQNHVARPPRVIPGSALVCPLQGVASQGIPGVGTSSRPPSTNITPNGLGGGSVPVGVATQVVNRGIDPSSHQDGFGMSALGIVPSGQPRPPTNTGLMQPAAPKPNPPTSTSSQVEANDAKALVVSGNGFSSDPVFGDVFSVTSSQPRQEAKVPASSTSNLPVSSAAVPASSANQSTVVANSRGSSQGTFVQQPLGSQPKQVQPTVRGNHQVPVQSSAAFTSSGVHVGAGNVSSGQSQAAWPRMTQSDVQKYTKVFVEVDTDRDGKISGDQARNLFLSWRLPREMLKQVWDLSDQDNDSMLSLREFCIALYLMERFREGRSLPTSFPPGIMLDGISLPTSGQPARTYNNATWRASPGSQRPGVTPGSQSAAPAARGRPPRPSTGPLLDEATIQPPQQKATVPSLEVHIVNQLSEGEQNSLKSKFDEATEANKKVEELEKEILDSRKKIEFYQSKMQELILYKSRCDNRLNEITERTSADKREAELLAKKYEEKYKQMGDVASKLTIEEATFRDIQDKKMELYRAIVKMEQDGKGDSIKVNAHQIESELEELVKSLNERCKSYGLRAKPTTLVELPFGWQPGIQEGSADWDENWDKFEDEGFSIVKELTLDVQNVIAPPKPKSTPLQRKPAVKDGVADDISPDGDGKSLAKPNGEEIHSESPNGKEDKSPPESPSHTSESPSKATPGSPSSKNVTADGSPHATETHRDTKPEDKSVDEPKWGASETQYDSDALWDSSSGPSKDNKFSESFFDSGDLGLPPIRTGSSFDDLFKRKSPFVFADSVPSTPLDSARNSPPSDHMFEQKSTFVFDSVPSTPQADNLFQNKSSFVFDSVPSTPHADNLFQNNSTYSFDSVPSTPQSEHLFQQKSAYSFDSVPSTPQSDHLFQQKSSYAFDSVPSTPMGDNLFQQKGTFGFDSVPSSPMYNYSNSDDQGFGNLSRFDSFNMSESNSFSQRDSSSFARFDSFRSTADSEYGQGFFHQPDSSSSLSRFDSFRSTTASEAGQGGVFPSKDYARFDSIRSNRDSDDNHGFNSFDDADPFGSSGPFKTSETPRRDSDNWRAF